MSKLAFVFPGQGAQFVGMGRDLYELPEARVVFDQVDAACGSLISKACFDGPEDVLKDTRTTQPALFAVSCAALAACTSEGLIPSACAGHSVGEYAALVAAGSVSVDEGAKLIFQRAAAMAQAANDTTGTMAAVLGLAPDVVAGTCAEVNHVGVVGVANLNSPGQVVISGETAAVEAATQLLKLRGAKRVLPLVVSGAFHSPLMALAAATMQRVLPAAEIANAKIPFVANVTADYQTEAETIRRNLAAQVAAPVRWVETIERLVGDGFTTFIECGPGNVLAGLIKRIAPDAKTYGVSDRASLLAAKEALKA